MQQFVITYTEDNDLGYYLKEIWVEGKDLLKCLKEQRKKHPIISGIRRVAGLSDSLKEHYSNECQYDMQKLRLEALKYQAENSK